MKSLLQKFDGWWHGLFMAAISYPSFDIAAKLCFHHYQTHPLVFSIFMIIWSSLILLLFSKGTNLLLDTIKSLHTWLVIFTSIIKIMTVSLGIYIVSLLSASEASVLLRVSTIILFFITAIMGQSTSKKELFASFILMIGVYIMFSNLHVTEQERVTIGIILFFRGLAQAIEFLSIEFHKANNKATTKKDTARVSALVVGISALIFLVFCIIMGHFKNYSNISILNKFPDPIEFFDAKIILITMVAGGLINGFSNYCKFHAAKTISSRYVLAMVSTQTLFILIYESLLSNFEFLNLRTFNSIELLSFVLVIVGSAGIAIFGAKKDKNRNSKQTELNEKYDIVDKDELIHALDLVKTTLSFVNNDIEKISEKLYVKNMTIIDLLALEETDSYNLSKKDYKSMIRGFHDNIESKDALTNLTNRAHLEKNVKSLIKKDKPFKLVFIDLDKFKYINDTYGHDAGDEVLKGFANNMLKSNNKGINARNGGDEFIMIVFEEINKVIDKLEKECSTIIKFNKLKFNMTYSLGISSFPSNAESLDDLIKIADENMYKNKKAK